jgi:hypothetical protein
LTTPIGPPPPPSPEREPAATGHERRAAGGPAPRRRLATRPPGGSSEFMIVIRKGSYCWSGVGRGAGAQGRPQSVFSSHGPPLTSHSIVESATHRVHDRTANWPSVRTPVCDLCVTNHRIVKEHRTTPLAQPAAPAGAAVGCHGRSWSGQGARPSETAPPRTQCRDRSMAWAQARPSRTSGRLLGSRRPRCKKSQPERAIASCKPSGGAGVRVVGSGSRGWSRRGLLDAVWASQAGFSKGFP